MREIMNYEFPKVEVIKIEIEQGFAGSSNSSDDANGIASGFEWGK